MKARYEAGSRFRRPLFGDVVTLMTKNIGGDKDKTPIGWWHVSDDGGRQGWDLFATVEDPSKYVPLCMVQCPDGIHCTRQLDHEGPCAHPCGCDGTSSERRKKIAEILLALRTGQPVPPMEEEDDWTLRELQVKLPWTVAYSQDFRANPQSHKDFAHALTHVLKASGKLAAIVDDWDHRRPEKAPGQRPEGLAREVANLVICALRMANTCPGGSFDLQEAVVRQLEEKNGVKL